MDEVVRWLTPALAALETTSVAATIGSSVTLIAFLSAAHLLGFTLIMGSALTANLRMLGVFLAGHAVGDVTRPASVGVAIGLLVSIATGFLLFAWRATELAANGTFQLKMLILLAAAVFHFTLHRRVAASAARAAKLRATGVVGLALWGGLALAGCALILFE